MKKVCFFCMKKLYYSKLSIGIFTRPGRLINGGVGCCTLDLCLKLRLPPADPPCNGRAPCCLRDAALAEAALGRTGLAEAANILPTP